MAHPFHHALSSVKRWGGVIEDYLPIHNFMDQSKAHMADYRHRALLHNTWGIFMLEKVFGTTITISTGRQIPVRWVGEQHVNEDLGHIPSVKDWLCHLKTEKWMNEVPKLELEF